MTQILGKVSLFSLVLLLLLVSVGWANDQQVSQADLEQLFKQLESEHFGTSLQAQNELVALGDQSVPGLENILSRSYNQWNRVKAVNVLGRIGSEDSIKVLLTAIRDREQIVRDTMVSAVEKLDQQGKEYAKSGLIEFAVDSDFTVRKTALDLLRRIGVDDIEIAKGLLEQAHKNKGFGKEKIALNEIKLLGIKAEILVPNLLTFYNEVADEQKFFLLEVITSVAKPDTARVKDILFALLFSPDWETRQEAIWGMRRLGLTGTEMITPVLELIERGTISEQEFAVDLLGQLAITQPDAVYALFDLVENEGYPNSLRVIAYQALKGLTSQLEWHLERGLVAVPTEEGIFLSWRLLGTEPADLGFNVYRDGQLVNPQPIVSSTNYLDTEGTLDSRYYVRPVLNQTELEPSETVAVWQQEYLAIPLQVPEGGVTPVGERYNYQANDGSVADLDGDGRYEIVLKWEPSNAKDNAHGGYTGNVYIDAYKFDGTFMWRIDLGPNIRAGAHYTQFMVYDLDGDGQAEIVMKTADGTIDGEGNVIGDPNADYRNNNGYVLSGPEYLTVFHGLTGKALATIDYDPPRGNVAAWGDSYGNRVDRFLAGIAYLDGVRPSVIMARGYYTRTVLVAYNWEDNQLKQVWKFDTNQPGMAAYMGQGNHQLSIADVDADGKDDIVYGSMTIGSDGKPLYNTRLGHGDALHVGDFHPERPGLEVYAVHESYPHQAGYNLRDARTGEILWGVPTNYDVGRGAAGKLDPNYPGYQFWASRSKVMTIDGQETDIHVPAMNFVIWWDKDLQRELLDGTTITKWDWENQRIVTLLSPRGAASNNGSKATPVLQADLFGDWREEVVWRSLDNRELRIYTTTDLTEHRLYTLMHDRMYRVAIAWQNVAYNQPPHPSFYVGEDMNPQTFNIGLIHNVVTKYAPELDL